MLLLVAECIVPQSVSAIWQCRDNQLLDLIPYERGTTSVEMSLLLKVFQQLHWQT